MKGQMQVEYKVGETTRVIRAVTCKKFWFVKLFIHIAEGSTVSVPYRLVKGWPVTTYFISFNQRELLLKWWIV